MRPLRDADASALRVGTYDHLELAGDDLDFDGAIAMNLSTTRSVDPLRVEAHVVLDDIDLGLVFGGLDAPIDLFYAVFSPLWPQKSVAQKLYLLAQLAERAEVAVRASNLNLSAAPPQPKE